MEHQTENICSVCIEPFNKNTRNLVKCYCGYECCKECVKKYLLDLSNDPECMSCKMKWDKKFMSEKLDKNFITKEYKKHRENILYEREMALFQGTQPYVERQIQIEKLEKEIEKLNDEYLIKLDDLGERLKELKQNKTIEKRKFIRKCPNNECQGFLSTALKCELCECFACGDCREIKGFTSEEKNAHECKKEILESIKILEKDSKPCPKCASLIFKINGCDQIYCVECHTAFSWKTLKIETGVIHNPHYFEYQMKQNNGFIPRNPLDIQCGRELDIHFINKLIKKLEPELPKGWTKEYKEVRYFHTLIRENIYRDPNGKMYRDSPCKPDKLIEICRNVIHIREVEQNRFRQTNRLENNLGLRIDYMRKKITKDKFKEKIQRAEKETIKRSEIYNILGMYTSVMTDLFYRLIENDDLSVKKEMEELRKHTNECLKTVSKIYNCKCYEINMNYILD